MRFIDIQTQYQIHKIAIKAAIDKVLETGNFIMGEEVFALERELAKYVGVKHCLAVSSGTDSLLIALMALGIGPGDEVITTPFTWISTAEVITLLRATPVFVDIDPDTYNMDINLMKKAITSKTKVIMPVSLFGQMPDYDTINAISEKHGIIVIEDGAQSFGATRNGKMSCGVTSIGSTSFFPAKPFGCYGDGGALFTNDDELAMKMRAIRTHGGEQRHHHPYLGINGRCDTIQAAIMLAKFPHYAEEVNARMRIGARYSKLLKDVCTTPIIEKGNTHVYAQYTIRVKNREKIMEELKKADIPCAIYYPKCLHEQPVFSYLGYKIGSFPVAEKASQEVLSLPMHPWLTEDDQDKIVDVLKKIRDRIEITFTIPEEKNDRYRENYSEESIRRIPLRKNSLEIDRFFPREL